MSKLAMETSDRNYRPKSEAAEQAERNKREAQLAFTNRAVLDALDEEWRRAYGDHPSPRSDAWGRLKA